MAQHDYNIANQSFPSFRTDLNNALSAIQTCNSGTSRPTGAVAGQIWLDTTSATSPTLKYYDGADDISLATIDHSANTVNWLDSTVSITGLTTTATGTVLTLSDSSLTSSVNLILQNQKEIRFSETTANGTNYVGFKAPASLSADKIWVLPSADGTAGQFLKTDGAGNLSFSSDLPTTSFTGATESTTLDTSDSLLIYDNSISALRKQTSAIFQTVKKITVNENIITQYSGLANGTHTLTNFNVTHTALSTSNKLAFFFSSGYYSTSGTNVGITEMYLNNGTSNVTESIYYDYAGASVSGAIEKSIFAGYFNLTPASTNAITYTIRIVIYRPSGSSTITVGGSSSPARLICVEYI